MTDYAPGGIITGPENSTVDVTLAPDECVLVLESDGYYCRRAGHEHEDAPVITLAAAEEALADALRFVSDLTGVPFAGDVAANILAKLTE